MARPKPIMNARNFSPDWVDPRFREAFVRLAGDKLFLSCETFRAQARCANDIINDGQTKNTRVPARCFAQFFGLSSESSFRSQLHVKDPDHLVCGRIASLSPGDINTVIGWVNMSINPPDPLTYEDLVGKIKKELGKDVTREALRKALARTKAVKCIQATPMEEARLNMNENEVARYETQAEALLQNVNPAFVFNMDETGIQAFADARKLQVVVPVDFEAGQINYPAKRSSQRSTLVSCIAADGTRVRPMLIIKQLNITQELRKRLWTEDKVVFKHTPTTFITRELFEDWFQSVFLPEVLERRRRFVLPSQPAFLVLDQCRSHSSAVVDELCSLNNIIFIKLAPHSSHIYQPLDRCLFGVLKKKLQRKTDKTAQTEYVHNILSQWELSATTPTIRGSFVLAGFVYNLVDGALVTSFRRDKVDKEGRAVPCEEEPDMRRMRI